MSDDTIPVGELQELVEYFQRRVEDNERKGSVLHDGIAVGRQRSANELRQLIEEHTDD